VTVSQTGVVDWLGIEKGSGAVSLTLIDDLDWNDERSHLLHLQEKLNAYLAFIESGEVYESLQRDLGHQVPTSTPIKITILAKFDLTPQSRAFLNHATHTLRTGGLSLSHRVVRSPEGAKSGD
jgi:hypothetical protein